MTRPRGAGEGSLTPHCPKGTRSPSQAIGEGCLASVAMPCPHTPQYIGGLLPPPLSFKQRGGGRGGGVPPPPPDKKRIGPNRPRRGGGVGRGVGLAGTPGGQ